jgi:hypothetical protein
LGANDVTGLDLFTAYGVELEYMLVDATSLDVRPLADQLIRHVAGEIVSEVEVGDLAWSNELALHVIELKTNGPAHSLAPLADRFQEQVRLINDTLQYHGAQLMPTAMHPWMDPERELHLWPHEYNPVYEALHRIFDCRGHGWANLQSVHLNLPFRGDEQFGRLHAAIRLLLPVLPALAASSPIVDRQTTGLQDNRLEVYRLNSDRVPQVTGQVIPEPVFSEKAYQRQILQPLYRAIEPLDPQKVLQYEWLNARGAIARFDRMTIEIRLLDVQECPSADLAICQAVDRVLKALVDQRWTSTADQQAVLTQPLAALLLGAIRDADKTVIDEGGYLAQFGLASKPLTAGEFWHHLTEQLFPAGELASQWPRRLVAAGPLSRRILRALDTESLPAVYAELCRCLAEGRLFG